MKQINDAILGKLKHWGTADPNELWTRMASMNDQEAAAAFKEAREGTGYQKRNEKYVPGLLIIFLNFNEFFGKTDEEVPTEDYARFVNLCHLWEKHIVITTTDGKLWGTDRRTKGEGFGMYWEYKAKALFATMHADGINVIDFSKQYWYYRHEYPEICYGSYHFANVLSTTTMWQDLMDRVAEAMTTGFVSASWKVAARTKGGLGEQKSTKDLVTEMRPQTDLEKARAVLQKITPPPDPAGNTPSPPPPPEGPKGSAVGVEKDWSEDALDNVIGDGKTRGSAAGGKDGSKGSAVGKEGIETEEEQEAEDDEEAEEEKKQEGRKVEEENQGRRQCRR